MVPNITLSYGFLIYFYSNLLLSVLKFKCKVPSKIYGVVGTKLKFCPREPPGANMIRLKSFRSQIKPWESKRKRQVHSSLYHSDPSFFFSKLRTKVKLQFFFTNAEIGLKFGSPSSSSFLKVTSHHIAAHMTLKKIYF